MTTKATSESLLPFIVIEYYIIFRSLAYQPVERNQHSTVRVGDYLYMWGGGTYQVVDGSRKLLLVLLLWV